METSKLQSARYKYEPKLPPNLQGGIDEITISFGEATEAVADREQLRGIFPETYGKPIARFVAGKNPRASGRMNVAVILSGGQAPGGHNVICGLFDAVKRANTQSRVFGYLLGPAGLLEDRAIELDNRIIDEYRNTGGFDMIGSGRTKIETPSQFDTVVDVCRRREIGAVVVIGGDDSNTNAALMAEYFAKKKTGIQVIGVPKTIDGDLKNEFIETSFGFDTAAKTYSELIGNIERDANSAKKYWHFIKLMGRSASHIALECALQCHPNICIISEEVQKNKSTLDSIVDDIVKTVTARAENGDNFGVALIPEGLIEFIPEMNSLIAELNDLLAANAAHFSSLGSFDSQASWISGKLRAPAAKTFGTLPQQIQRQLLMDRDPHGNVQVSRIETEKLLIQMAEVKLANLKKAGSYKGAFSALAHFFGYEGRCAFPSNFDADYCYSLGYCAFALIAGGVTGYIASVRDLSLPAANRSAGGVPLTMMMNLEQRHGSMKPVIRKALVDLDGKPFQSFAEHRTTWATKTSYAYPGAIQYYGPDEVCNQPTMTLALEHA